MLLGSTFFRNIFHLMKNFTKIFLNHRTRSQEREKNCPRFFMSSVLFTLITLLSWRMMTAPHGPPTEAEDMFCADDFGNKGTPKLEDTLLLRYPTYLGRQQ